MTTQIDGREGWAEAAQSRSSMANEIEHLRIINFALLMALEGMVAPRVGTRQDKAIQLSAARIAARDAIAKAKKGIV